MDSRHCVSSRLRKCRRTQKCLVRGGCHVPRCNRYVRRYTVNECTSCSTHNRHPVRVTAKPSTTARTLLYPIHDRIDDNTRASRTASKLKGIYRITCMDLVISSTAITMTVLQYNNCQPSLVKQSQMALSPCNYRIQDLCDPNKISRNTALFASLYRPFR